MAKRHTDCYDLPDEYEKLLQSITTDDLTGAHIAVPHSDQLRDALCNLAQSNSSKWTKKQFGLLLILNGLACILSDEITLDD